MKPIVSKTKSQKPFYLTYVQVIRLLLQLLLVSSVWFCINFIWELNKAKNELRLKVLNWSASLIKEQISS
ncbi:MAG: hypothetical protein NZ480_01950, partial [Bdellovibrionaceae bacterium]|nr:hypothetical protein [Pseudobdellovibrionaceae bacterium]MDW8191146.1 hypothetical protein [Pseudobdellovibrionaceae bacterium]